MSTKPRSSRHRPSERFAPRPSDFIADRLRPLAAWARKVGAAIEVDGERLDADRLESIADAQARAERDLEGTFGHFKTTYAAFDDVRRARQRILDEAIRLFAADHHDREARNVLRLARLRRPPLAKVHAIVAAARSVA